MNQLNKERLTILETVRVLPFTCLNCDEKVLKLRDLARLGCHCIRPFYHYHCLAALPVNLCMKCNRRAHTLRGIKAIWDSFTHDEWKHAFNLNLLKESIDDSLGANGSVNQSEIDKAETAVRAAEAVEAAKAERVRDRASLIELMDSMLLDWDTSTSPSTSSNNISNNSKIGNDAYGLGLTLNFLICDYWKVCHLLDNVANTPSIHTIDLILDRLEDALRIYPLEDNVIIGSKNGVRRLIRNPRLRNHSDFLTELWIRSQTVVSPTLLEWIREDLVRHQSIFFSGPLIFDILYGRNFYGDKEELLIIQILGLDDSIIKKLLTGLLEKLNESFSYYTYTSKESKRERCSKGSDEDLEGSEESKRSEGSEESERSERSEDSLKKDSWDEDELMEPRRCYLKNLGQNRLKLVIEGLSQPIEIHISKSNDIRKILINSKAGAIPYLGDGLIVSPSGLWTTLRWLYACREMTVLVDSNNRLSKENKNTIDLKKIIDIEPIKHGFLISTDLSRLRREFSDPYIDYDDLDDDIEEKFIPDDCMRITIDNLWNYMMGEPLFSPNSNDENLPLKKMSDAENLHSDRCSGHAPARPELSFDSSSDTSDLDKTDLGHLWSNNRKNEELIADLIRRITYNKKNNILDTLPNPYMPQRVRQRY